MVLYRFSLVTQRAGWRVTRLGSKGKVTYRSGGGFTTRLSVGTKERRGEGGGS